MTTLRGLIDETRLLLSPERREQIDKLNGAIDATTATVVVTYADNAVANGKRLSVDLEDIHIFAGSSKTTTAVQRGVGGSVAEAHANGALVYLDSVPTPYEIARAINRKLEALPGEGIFAFPTTTLTGSATTIGYDLDVDNLISVHRVAYQELGSSNDWPALDRSTWTFDLAADTDVFASGQSLSIFDAVAPGRDVKVQYKAGFTALTLTAATLDAVVEASGIEAYAVPLLSLGAAILLTLGRAPERARLDSQGNTRRPDEVSTSEARLSSNPLQVEYQQALSRARREQIRKYGT